MPIALDRAATSEDAGGHTLPTAWPTLEAQGVNIRSAELTVVAGQPAAGKSAFALATAVKMGIPTLYFAADTAAWTMAIRAVAMVTGLTQDVVEAKLTDDPHSADGAFESLRYIRWCFDSAPTLDDIDDEVSAYEEVWGRNPDLIVIDNLVDVSDGDDEWAAVRRTQKELKFLARETGAAVVVLHHVTEAFRVDDNSAPSRSSILGKDTRLPALVLTVTNQDGFLGVAIVKNRYGKADPSGRSVTWFTFDGARMSINELEH
jgi:replicative DNA helicase